MSSGGSIPFHDSSPIQSLARTPSKVDVKVDTCSLSSVAPADVVTACSLPELDSMRKPEWDGWVSFEGKRVAATPGGELVPVYAVRLADGAAVCISNQSNSRIEIKLTVHLPAGVYSIERLGFGFGDGESPPVLERLSGRIFSSEGTIRKPGWLLPGVASIYKFTNHTAQANTVYRNVRRDLELLHRSDAPAFRRIMVPLGECWDHLGPISGGIDPDKKEACLKHIHRALLTLAHAQSLANNFGGNGVATGKITRNLSGDLDKLQGALTELSVGCLGLVPGTSVSTPDAKDPLVRKITVSIANQGGKAVSFVRLGAAAPKGSRIWPQEEAMFDTLRPGETVRADFKVRLPDESAAKGLVANIGYFAQRAPAHLSLQAF